MTEFKKLNITDWALGDRPREKLISKGISSLSDAELMAILIGSGNKNETAVDLSKRILNENNNNLNELAKLSLNDLEKYKGIGEAKAITIIAALELGRRRNFNEAIERKKITSSRDAFEIFSPIISDLPYEEFWILLLNRSNKIIDKIRISSGGITGTIADIRIILKEAILKNSIGIIICHNHPSGNIEPSTRDVELTKKIKSAAEIMDIAVLDHVIIAENTFYSFADEGDL